MDRYILIKLLITVSLNSYVNAQLPKFVQTGGMMSYEFAFKNYDDTAFLRDTFTLYYWNDPVSDGYYSLLFKNDSFIELVEGWRKTTRLKNAGSDRLFIIDLNQWFLGNQSSLKYFPNLGKRELDSFFNSMSKYLQYSSHGDNSMIKYTYFKQDTIGFVGDRFYLEKIYSPDLGVFVFDSSYYTEFGEEQILSYRMLDFKGSCFENISFEAFRDSLMEPIYKECTLVDYSSYRHSRLKEYRKTHKPIQVGDTFDVMQKWIGFNEDTIEFNDIILSSKDSTACQYVILDFFYLNCGPCIVLLSELAKHKDAYASNCKWISVNIANDSKDRIERYFSKMDLEPNVILNGSELLMNYEIFGFPLTLVLDKQGVVVEKVVGYYEGFHTDLMNKISDLNH